MFMGLLIDGVWSDDSLDATRFKDGRFNRPTTKYPQLDHARRQPRPLRAKAASRPSPAAITSMFRWPAPGRTAR